MTWFWPEASSWSILCGWSRSISQPHSLSGSLGSRLSRRRRLRSGLRFLDALGAAVETGRARGDPHDAASSRRDVEHIERQRMNVCPPEEWLAPVPARSQEARRWPKTILVIRRRSRPARCGLRSEPRCLPMTRRRRSITGLSTVPQDESRPPVRQTGAGCKAL
jgi:hypothetical protein